MGQYQFKAGRCQRGGESVDGRAPSSTGRAHAKITTMRVFGAPFHSVNTTYYDDGVNHSLKLI